MEPLALHCRLNPNFYADTEMSFKFDYFKMLRCTRPIMVPTYDTIAFIRIMLVGPEVRRFIFEFNSNSLLTIANFPICYAVWILGPNLFDSELQLFCNLRKQKNDPQFIFRSILQWGII